ncbi:DUF1453 domain-containing protein [Streptomyces sp. NPDC002577]
MSGLFDVLLILAVVVLVVVRQFRARQISADRRWWVVPGVLIFMALRGPGVIDAHHPGESAALLAAELLIGIATGAGWAWTTRVWAAPDGAVWSKSTKASVLVWLAGIGLRAGLFGAGALLGVHQGTAALLLALAVTLLVRSGILVWRSQFLGTPADGVPAPGEGASLRSWKSKERV